ncbi:tetratricopeptide repeat-containing sensor histidine kinase [Pontibacter sp. FD36]|uniref:tetratricopeptide repeat-containing sensor histidine kinase n=1 Tax=Pontibacter sp. FD36 TaxID=2789860 RepID=UPI0018AA6464|nr:tetratricopeptide repeat-containing sensor histidine kinase [Pontibacter sp. FD36]MBF8962655.1 tetratricopeptide repeat-containing sensor histidine kinase [Pontibacter sp. FD36]
MLLLLLTRLFLLISLTQPQQKILIQDLKTELDQTEDVTRKIELYCELSKVHKSINPKTTISYGNKAVALAQKAGDDKLLAQAYNETGSGHYLLGDIDKAVKFYYMALRIREKLGDPSDLSASYNNIGNVYADQHNHKEALPLYKKSLSLATTAQDTLRMSSSLSNIGGVYLDQGKYDLALVYYREALPIQEGLDDKQGILISLINIGEAYNGKNDYQTALTYFNKAHQIANNLGSPHDEVYVLRGKAESYLKAGKYEKALDNALASMELAKAYEGKYVLKENAAILDRIYAAMGNYEMAHHYLTLHMAYNDSLHNERAADRIAQERVKYETAQKDKENLLLRAEQELNLRKLEQRSIVQYFTIALLLLVCAMAYVFFRGRQHQSRINKLLTQKNELIMHKNGALNQHQKALTEQAQQLNIQKEKLTQLNTIKDKLFSVIAHDLRGPLVALKGLLHVMAMGKVPADKQAGLFNSLVKGQQNVLWMLDNLFDWARAQMEGFEADPKPLPLRELADENIRLLQPVASSKEIVLENKIDPNLTGCADKEMVRLVLRNLISNGIKFCKAGDTVTLTAKLKNDFVLVSVKDTGIGITQEVQKKLFGGSSYSSRGTANEKGSGLGLALCKDFVEHNGGSIWVESMPGKGSTFLFTLPHTVKAEEDEINTPPSSEETEEKTAEQLQLA